MTFVVSNYFRNIGRKVKVSSLHVSALLDILTILLIPFIIFSFTKLYTLDISTRQDHNIIGLVS